MTDKQLEANVQDAHHTAQLAIKHWLELDALSSKQLKAYKRAYAYLQANNSALDAIIDVATSAFDEKT